MKFREHKASFLESMATEVELGGRPELIEHIRKVRKGLGVVISSNAITTMAFDAFPDKRNGWKQTYAVRLRVKDNEHIIVGWSDEP